MVDPVGQRVWNVGADGTSNRQTTTSRETDRLEVQLSPIVQCCVSESAVVALNAALGWDDVNPSDGPSRS